MKEQHPATCDLWRTPPPPSGQGIRGVQLLPDSSPQTWWLPHLHAPSASAVRGAGLARVSWRCCRAVARLCHGAHLSEVCHFLLPIWARSGCWWDLLARMETWASGLRAVSEDLLGRGRVPQTGWPAQCSVGLTLGNGFPSLPLPASHHHSVPISRGQGHRRVGQIPGVCTRWGTGKTTRRVGGASVMTADSRFAGPETVTGEIGSHGHISVPTRQWMVGSGQSGCWQPAG